MTIIKQGLRPSTACQLVTFSSPAAGYSKEGGAKMAAGKGEGVKGERCVGCVTKRKERLRKRQEGR